MDDQRFIHMEQELTAFRERLARLESEQGLLRSPAPDAVPPAMRPSIVVSPAFDEEFYKLCSKITLRKTWKQRYIPVAELDPLLEAFERIAQNKQTRCSTQAHWRLRHLQTALDGDTDKAVRDWAVALIAQLIYEGSLE